MHATARCTCTATRVSGHNRKNPIHRGISSFGEIPLDKCSLETIEQVKSEIKAAQYKAAVSVNQELILLHHSIGEVINAHKVWGSKFIDSLAKDIKIAFPNVKGYSVRNLKYMAKFAATYPDRQFVQTVSAQIPWPRNVAILDKVKDPDQRIWYIQKTAENGWSHNVLVH